MKNQYIIIIITFLIIVLLTIFVLNNNKTNNRTNQTALPNIFSKIVSAKQAYNIALKEANKFADDSYLVGLYASGVNEKGLSKNWYVIFYSPAKKTGLKINVTEGKIGKTDESNKKEVEEIPRDWVDTDQIAKTAIPKCGTTIDNDYFFTLKPASTNKTSTWTVNCKVGEDKTLFIDINATNGDYIKTRRAGIGW